MLFRFFSLRDVAFLLCVCCVCWCLLFCVVLVWFDVVVVFSSGVFGVFLLVVVFVVVVVLFSSYFRLVPLRFV